MSSALTDQSRGPFRISTWWSPRTLWQWRLLDRDGKLVASGEGCDMWSHAHLQAAAVRDNKEA